MRKGYILGYKSWAMVSDELVARLESGDERVELSKEDWNCGDKKIIVDEVGMVEYPKTFKSKK